MRMVSKIIVIFIAFYFFPFYNVIALETDTHEIINEHIFSTNLIGFSMDLYLKNRLGFENGIDEIFRSGDLRKAFEWAKLGGKYEDLPPSTLPYRRSVNHFHDPISNEGYSGFWGTGIMSGISSVLWLQKPIGTQGTESGGYLFNLGGNFSWHDARDYFYKALISRNNTDKERNYADTFRSVGQIMHLVQDASVPAHTRNDGHVGYHYEIWVKKKIDKNDLITFTPITYDKSILNLPLNSPLLLPITNIIDTDRYIGTNAGDATGTNIGLAEYANANYFSEDTIFMNYPHPAREETNFADFGLLPLTVITTPNGISHNVHYIKKNSTGKKIAAVKYLAKSLWDFPNVQYKLTLMLDNRCYEEYARDLIPRAVGYSAGLLNYFFRGTIEITPPEQYVYSIIDGGVEPQQFTRIKAKLKNTTEDEALLNGSLVAVAKYIKRTDYQPDLSADPPDVNSLPAEFSYSVSAMKLLMPEELASMNAHPTEFIFDFSDDPIPAGITDLSLQVVFKGTLGNEKDNAIAVGYKDLMEPTHHAFWNLTDMFSLRYSTEADSTPKHHLVTEQQIRDNSTLASLVDINGNGIFNETGEPYISPYELDYEVAYTGSASPSNPVMSSARVSELPAGRYIRVVLLVDKLEGNYLKLGWTHSVEAGSDSAVMPFHGAINQDVNGTFTYMPVEAFRTIRQHYRTGILRCHPKAYDQTGRSYCPYNDQEAQIPPDLAPYEVEITY
jgi:hypothetical protein